MYTSELRPEISQGDVFREVDFALLNGNGEPVKVKATVLLLSHDCDFDKPNNPYCLVAMITPLASVPADHQDNIQNYRVISTFYLPESPNTLVESYVDLRLQATLQTLPPIHVAATVFTPPVVEAPPSAPGFHE